MLRERHRQDTVGVLGMDAFGVYGLRQLEAAAEALADELAQMHFGFFLLLFGLGGVAHRQHVAVYVDLQILLLAARYRKLQGIVLVVLLHIHSGDEVGVAAGGQDIVRAEERTHEVVVEEAGGVGAAGAIGYE